MSGKGAAGGFDFQARINAFIAVYMLAEKRLSWTKSGSGDVPAAIRAETGGAGDDVRIDLAGSDVVYECQAKLGLSADERLDDAAASFAALKNEPHQVGVLLVDPGSARTIRIDLRRALSLCRQGAGDAPKGALKRVRSQLETLDAEAVLRRLYVQELDLEEDASATAQNAIILLERCLEDPSRAGAAWGVLVADGLRMCKEGGRRTRDDIVALLGQERILLAPPAHRQGEGPMMQSALAEVLTNTRLIIAGQSAGSTTDAFTVQLDLVKQQLEQSRFQTALDLLGEIEANVAGAAVTTQVRLHNLKAVALLRLDKTKEAKDTLLRVLSFMPHDSTALANLAVAEMMLQDYEAAVARAEAAIRIDPTVVGPWVVLVQMRPGVSAPAAIAEDPAILAGRAIPLMKAGKWAEAIPFLRGANAGEFNPERALLLAQGLHGLAGEQTDAARVSHFLEEALALVDKALGVVEGRPMGLLLERLLLARGQMKSDLGDDSAALSAFVRASRTFPQSRIATVLLAGAYLQRDDPGSALAVLDLSPAVPGDVTLLTQRARAFLGLKRTEEARRTLLSAVAAARAEPRDWADSLVIVEAALDTDDVDLAVTLLAEIPRDSWEVHYFRARIGVRRGDEQQTRANFEEALKTAPPSAAKEILGEYAGYLRRQGHPVDAITVLERGNAGDLPSLRPVYGRSLYEAKQLVKAAALLERQRAEHDVLPLWALQLGANIAIARDDAVSAKQYLGELATRRTEDVEIVLRFAHALLRLGEVDEAKEVLDAASKLPHATPRELLHLAAMYERAGRPAELLPLAFRALRAEPDAEDVQLAYISLFLKREQQNERFEVEAVAPDTGVVLRDPGGEEMRYFIVTDRPPRRDAGELVPDEPMAQVLIGKRPGDVITLRPGGMTEAAAVLKAVNHRYVHVFQDILLRFPERHPQSTALQRIKFPQQPTAADFQIFADTLRARAELGVRILDYYSKHGLPLGVVATMMKGNLAQAYELVRTSDKHALLVEYSDAVEASKLAASSPTPAVLTRSSLLTVQRLELFDRILSVHSALLVPQSLLDELQEEREELANAARSGYSALSHGQSGIVHQAQPPEYYGGLLQRFDEVVRWVATNCEICPRSLESVEREATNDESLRTLIGASSSDSLDLAEERSAELFADDLGLRRMLRARNGRCGFSTYALLLAGEGTVVPTADVVRHVATLFRLRHVTLLLTPAVFCTALEMNGYKFDGNMMVFLTVLGGSDVDLQKLVIFIVNVLVLLAVVPGGKAHIGSAVNALVGAAAERQNARRIVTLVEALARVRMQLLPGELDEVLAAVQRYTRFAIDRVPSVVW